MDKFDFIDIPLLRRNIENVQDDISALGTLLSSPEKETTKECIRKTIVIYTASIIEAILLWKLRKELGNGKVVLKDAFIYKEIDSVSLQVASGNDVVIAEKVKEVRDLGKMDFVRRIDVCEKYGIIKNKKLIKKLHKTRDLRNKVHIDEVKKVKKNHSQKELDFIFAALEETIQAIV